MLTKAVVFLFCIMAVFGLLTSSLSSSVPELYYVRAADYQDKTIASYYSTHNYTMYTSQQGGTMTYPFENKTIPTSLGGDNYLELYWQYWILGYPATGEKAIWMKHASLGWFGFVSGHYLEWEGRNSPIISKDHISLADCVNNWNGNDSFFSGSCEHLTVNLILMPTIPYTNIEDSWNNDTLVQYSSYTIDLNGTSLSIWSLVGQLFTFQTPPLGLGGIGEILIGGVVGAFMWALVIIVIYKITMGIIPWVSGGSGD